MLNKDGCWCMSVDNEFRRCISETLKLRCTPEFSSAEDTLSRALWRFHLASPSIKYAWKAIQQAEVPVKARKKFLSKKYLKNIININK